jgi:hypothetical protein
MYNVLWEIPANEELMFCVIILFRCADHQVADRDPKVAATGTGSMMSPTRSDMDRI